MKTGFFTIVCVALIQLAAPKPHNHQGSHHKHLNREAGVVTVTKDLPTVIVSTPANYDVDVLEDKNGKPTATVTSTKNTAPAVQEKLAAPNNHAPAPVPAPKPINPLPSSPPSTGGSAPNGPGFGAAVTYSPYNADNSCKSTQQVAGDFQKLTGYQLIRLYGTDCNQVANVLAATNKKVKLMAGIFNIDNILGEIGIMTSAVNGDWSLINSVTVGNELVNTGAKTVAQVTAAIGATRAALKAKGYTGPVVTVDTMTAVKNNPSLCKDTEFCAINCHAFFDPNEVAQDAGKYVAGWVKQVSDAAGGKITVVTESGWPSQGQPNGNAVPSPQNQQAAVASLKSVFSTNMVLYSAFNDLWKAPGAYNAEKFWGIMGNA